MRAEQCIAGRKLRQCRHQLQRLDSRCSGSTTRCCKVWRAVQTESFGACTLALLQGPISRLPLQYSTQQPEHDLARKLSLRRAMTQTSRIGVSSLARTVAAVPCSCHGQLQQSAFSHLSYAVNTSQDALRTKIWWRLRGIIMALVDMHACWNVWTALDIIGGSFYHSFFSVKSSWNERMIVM
jgi:hypothetical protein